MFKKYQRESKSTPCQIVFNSNANFHGQVLNKYFTKGPDIMNKLFGVLLRLRKERIRFIEDIPKMFHSIKIPLRDQMTHLFISRDLVIEKEPDTYAVTVVNMGDSPSATIVIAALIKTAERKEKELTEAAKTISDNSCMDDIIDTIPNKQEAIRRTGKIEQILNSGSFKRNGQLQGTKEQIII